MALSMRARQWILMLFIESSCNALLHDCYAQHLSCGDEQATVDDEQRFPEEDLQALLDDVATFKQA
jgi:hypothetical protein